MGQLTGEKQAILQHLTQTAPDSALYSLERALAGSAGDPTLGVVCALVSAEAAARRMRDWALAPMKPMFAPAAPGRLRFPPALLRQLWAALQAWRPNEVRAATQIHQRWDPEATNWEPFDALCQACAEGLRTAPNPSFAALAADPHAPELASCLDLAAVVRAALPHLGDWVTRMNDDRRAAIRLAYRDAVEVSDDAGPRFFNMMDAHLGEPWQVLRVISAAMDRPTEVYLASSELANFATRTLDSVDQRLATTRDFDPSQGAEPCRLAGQAVLSAGVTLAEIEDAIETSKERPWGKAVAAKRKALAATVEARLGEIEAAVDKALPMVDVRIGRKVHQRPGLNTDPDFAAVGKAKALLIFAEEVRPGASRGGFGSIRTKALEALEERITTYVEDVLDLLRTGDAESPERAQAFLAIAADLYALAKDEKSAQIIRRRAAAASWTPAEVRASA